MSVEVETSLQLSSEGEIFVRSYYCDRMINEAYDHPRHAIGAQSYQSKPGRPHGYIYDFLFPNFQFKTNLKMISNENWDENQFQ